MRKLNLNGKNPIYIGVFFFTIVTVICLLLFVPMKSTKISVSIFSACAIDNVIGAVPQEGTWVAPRSTQLIPQGWAGDPIKSTNSSEIFLELVDSQNNVIKTVMSRSDFNRPDVAKAYGNPTMEYTGFNIDFGVIEAPGDYSIVIGNVNTGQVQICTTPFKLKIT